MIRKTLPVLLLASATASAAEAPEQRVVRDVRMFERVDLGDGISVVAFGVMEDSRCTPRNLCLRDDRLVIDTVLTWRDGEREAPFAVGTRYPVPGGSVVFAGTTTPPSDTGAIRLKEYRLDFVFVPER